MEEERVNNGEAVEEGAINEGHELNILLRQPVFNYGILPGLQAHLLSQIHHSLSRTFNLFCFIPSKRLGVPNLQNDYMSANKDSNEIAYFLVPSGETNIRIFHDHFGSDQIMTCYNCYVQKLQRPLEFKSIANWVALLTLTFILDTRHYMTLGPNDGAKFFFGFNMSNNSIYVKSITSTWTSFSRRVITDNQNIGGHVFCAPVCHNTCPHRKHPCHINFSRFRPYVISPNLKLEKSNLSVDRFYFHALRHSKINKCVLRPLLFVEEGVSMDAILRQLDEKIKHVEKTLYLVAVKTGDQFSLYVGVTVETVVPRVGHWKVPDNDSIKLESSLANMIRPNSRVYLLHKETLNEVEACLREALFQIIIKYRELDVNHSLEENQVINIRTEYTAALSLLPEDHICAALYLASDIPVLSLTGEELRANDDWIFPSQFRPMVPVDIPQEFMDYVHRKYPPPEVIDLISDSE